MKKQSSKKITVRKVAYWLCLSVFLCVFLYSAFRIGSYIVESIEAKQLYQSLQEMADSSRPTRPALPEATQTPSIGETGPAGETLPDPPVSQPNYVTVIDPDTNEPIDLLPEYSALYLKNTDLVGWLEVPGTVISYPVMQSPETPDFYLRHNFAKDWDSHGCIYARETCDIFAPSDNITIYGHNKRDGTMFSDLEKYMDQKFYEEHKHIYFDTIFQRHTYEIIAVFPTSASVGVGFRYHTFENAATAEAFDAFIAKCKQLSYYDIPATAEYGNKLITLSTCEYSQVNGRLVIVAKRIY